jgi:UDP-2,4-diacetamido-2,4,6-trideoxy-beta-L-altropyranose hydrolase
MADHHKAPKQILIRVDASPEIGAGHLMRMLALGQLLLDAGFGVHFATIPHNPSILDFLRKEDFNLVCFNPCLENDISRDSDQLLELSAKILPSWIILDGNRFDETYECQIREKGFRLLRVVDIPNMEYEANIILNQNYGAEEMNYQIKPHTKILAGLRYLLVRREFRLIDSKIKRGKRKNTFHILVTLGGGTKSHRSLYQRILESIVQIKKLDISCTMIIGNFSKDLSFFVKYLEANVFSHIEIKRNSSNMAEEMLRADLAITAAGSTMWELIFMKVPFLALSLNEPQKEYLEFLAKAGLCINLGWYEDLSVDSAFETILDFANNCNLRSQMQDKMGSLINRKRYGKELLEILST